MVKKPIGKFILRNVEADDLINQAKGLRAIKERKRTEKHLLNLAKFDYPDTRMYKEIIKARNKMVKQ